MTDVELLCALKEITERCTGDMLLPVRMQEEDEEEPKPRAAKVFLVRLPEMGSAEKKAPYILHTAAEGVDKYTDHHDGYGGRENTRHLGNTVEIRSVFCVYSKDGQEGGLYLLELIDRVRRELLSHPVIGLFHLDLEAGLERMIYDSEEWDLGPYNVGGLVTKWIAKDPARPQVQDILNGATGPESRRMPLPLGLWGQAEKTVTKGAMTSGEQEE